MKTLPIVVASLVFGASSLSFAQNDATRADQDRATTGTVKASDFKTADSNRDGSLDKTEAAVLGIRDSEFQSADTNGDGKLSEREFTAMIEQRGGTPGNS